MSSYISKFRNKKTGEVVEVYCMDDYFGKHRYGYEPKLSDAGNKALNEEQFRNEYEILVKEPTNERN